MYYSLNQAFRSSFGKKGYKIALSAGMTCPNRDGTLGTGGCLFCSGAGEFAQKGTSVTTQIEEGAKRIEKKNKDGLYIAYFQDYTNTYAPVSRLRALFTEAISHPRVAVLSVATRPDCLPGEVLDLLEELNRIKPVWVELGLQTIHESTAAWIRRGYPLSVYDTAAEELRRRGIKVVTHLILGLPGETEEMVYQTVAHVGERTDGVKFHLLHVVKGTDLEAMYRQGAVSTMSFPAYARLLGECINRLPPNVVIHRLTGDGDKRTLVAPLWSGDKKHVLNALNQRFREENVKQGKLYIDN
ncbi:MAG: TIGR01212 family radical SAM protein [Ruminococcaceae bacterium]|nr:TIGR01212 family radical SAM protein [Oscillospiraceae bacterium]